MNFHRQRFLPSAAALAAGLLGVGCGTESSARIDPALPSMNSREVGSCMAGDFSNEQQAKSNSSFESIRVHLRPIWVDRIDGLWLYVEQSLASSEDKPYRQRIYQIVDGNDADSVECRMYALPGDAAQYAGEWKLERPMRKLTADLLLPISGCTITLRENEDKSWSGSTQPDECVPPGSSGVSSMTALKIDHGSFEVWDRTMNSDGQQVGGSTVGPYLFTRIGK